MIERQSVRYIRRRMSINASSRQRISLHSSSSISGGVVRTTVVAATRVNREGDEWSDIRSARAIRCSSCAPVARRTIRASSCHSPTRHCSIAQRRSHNVDITDNSQKPMSMLKKQRWMRSWVRVRRFELAWRAICSTLRRSTYCNDRFTNRILRICTSICYPLLKAAVSAG